MRSHLSKLGCYKCDSTPRIVGLPYTPGTTGASGSGLATLAHVYAGVTYPTAEAAAGAELYMNRFDLSRPFTGVPVYREYIEPLASIQPSPLTTPGQAPVYPDVHIPGARGSDASPTSKPTTSLGGDHMSRCI